MSKRYTQDELLDDQVAQVMVRMGDRFATRLGRDSDALISAHRQCAGTLARPLQKAGGT